MPFAVTHILFPIIILDLLKNHIKKLKRITIHTIFIAGIAGILPDIDVVFDIVFSALGMSLEIHRMFTHTLIIPVLFVIAALLLRGRPSLFAAAFGWTTHVVLDFLLIGEVILFFPLTAMSVGLNPLVFLPQQTVLLTFAGLDAVLFLVWLWHEEKYKKLKDFL